ncbi:Crp/Fnr family transcriptional regulator [Saccharothrix lopnurensis]|uniref:Crp/Fnr family transcriptional regulator n=1 Tax=Saccharothrix lopnurensis TaxID=1670621 RepID=A0ABW1PD83_9PSEU
MSTYRTPEREDGPDAGHTALEVEGSPWLRGSFLGRLPAPERHELLSAGRLVNFRPGEFLVREGDMTTSVYVLLTGMAKVTVNASSGHTTLLAIRVAGDIIGEMAPIDEAPRSASVAAALPTRAAALTGDAFLKFLGKHPKASLEMLRTISYKLRSATAARSITGGYPVTARLAQVLRDLGHAYGKPGDQGLEIHAPLTQADLAALVGASQPAVHKALRTLRDQGAIRTGYRSISIASESALDEVADSETA